MQKEVSRKQKLYIINENELQNYLDKRKINYTKEEIINLANTIINFYILKYPSEIDENKNLDLSFEMLIQGLTERQKRFISCPYSINSKKIILRLYINTIYQINARPLMIEVDEKTGIVDDFSIMCLTEYYRNLSNNITVEELFDIIKVQNDCIDCHEIEEYLKRKQDYLELRDIILSYIKGSLRHSDLTKSTGEYRNQMFEQDFINNFFLKFEEDDKLTRTKKIEE